jgi:hypothetical protein
MSHHPRSRFDLLYGFPVRVAAGSFLLLILFAVSVRGDSLTWQTGQGFRRAKVDFPQAGHVGFRKLEANQLGIPFTNRLSHDRAILNQNLPNGSGVAAGDVDGDGWCDLYFCGLESDNALYRNLGNWKFTDITATAGVACPNQDATGAVFVDGDGDGDLDLLVTSLGQGVRLFENDGQGHFREVTESAGLKSNSGAMSMSLADVDGDGDLDLYVANYRTDTIASQPSTTFQVQMVQGKPVVVRVNGQPATLPQWTNRFEIGLAGNVMERGEPDVLYLNDGTGKFTAASFTDGTFLDEDGRPLSEPPRDWGLSVQMRDFTGDGTPDIYVCNDFYTPDRIWINDGKGRFRAMARTAIRTTSTFSMGVDFADINRDGNVDFFVADMLSPDHRKRHVQLGERTPFRWPAGILDNRPQVNRNTLQVNRGDGTFAETSWFSGVEASDWSWCPLFLDVDLDGFEDILISNGVLHDFQNIDVAERVQRRKAGPRFTQSEILQLVGQFPRLETPNVIFRNQGDGTFESVGAAWGFDASSISQGMALADLDNDGDMDIVMNNLQDAPGVFRNEGSAPRVAVQLKASAPNRAGIGARIKIRGGPVEQTQEMICGGRYLSGDQAQRAFAAGSATAKLEIEVVWRNGKRSVVPAEPNHIYEIDEAGAEPMGSPKNPVVSPLFEAVKTLPPAVHAEAAFDDLLRQPLLTRLFSQAGPGVCWHDINQDGWDDLIIGSGRGGRLTVLENRNGTGFSLSTNALLAREVTRDQTAILGMARSLLVGSSNYEDGVTNGGLIHIYDFQRNAAGDSVLGSSFSTGPLSFADVDDDGDLDLFIGGRAIPGRYPEPADSLLLRNEGGKFVVSQRWEKLGLVTGAVFSDLDQDGFPELILASEWGPVRVFKLVNGKYEDRTREWGLGDYTGWWQGVATGDFDGDGRLEIVASNWGLNSRARASREHPRKIYFGDFDGNGDFDLLEARFVPEIGKEAPDLTFDVVRAAMPFLQERITSFAAYGGMSIREILGESFPRASVREVNTLESMSFSWRDGKFEGKPLPSEAQLAPAFGICIGDLDGDGDEDLFLSQNFFAVAGYESRCDAGRGLLLKGNGLGELSPVPGPQSGIEVYGEQRGCALSDYDGDGRSDLVVAQNGNSTKLYHNVDAAPGLRVRLKGPSGNPSAVGASLRLECAGKMGPLREVQAGSGYWSQNSAVQVLAGKSMESAKNIWVRWPGGKETITPVPGGAREIEVSRQGVARQVR